MHSSVGFPNGVAVLRSDPLLSKPMADWPMRSRQTFTHRPQRVQSSPSVFTRSVSWTPCFAQNSRTTGELCAEFRDLDRCTVMQHIGVLEKAGLVISRREGRRRWNHLNALPIKQIHDRWISPYAVSAVHLLARLKDDLESRA